jgi:hypothetical protein
VTDGPGPSTTDAPGRSDTERPRQINSIEANTMTAMTIVIT